MLRRGLTGTGTRGSLKPYLLNMYEKKLSKGANRMTIKHLTYSKQCKHLLHSSSYSIYDYHHNGYLRYTRSLYREDPRNHPRESPPFPYNSTSHLSSGSCSRDRDTDPFLIGNLRDKSFTISICEKSNFSPLLRKKQ